MVHSTPTDSVAPRVDRALETFVYGAQTEGGHRKMDADRLSYLVDGLSSYAAAETNAGVEPVWRLARRRTMVGASGIAADGRRPTMCGA